MKKLFLFALLIALAGSSFAQAIPMNRGCTWTYAVTVQYMKGEQEATKTFTVKMKVTDYAFRSDGYRVALITGNPQQYAFYEEGNKYNEQYALLRTPSKKYYMINLGGKPFKQLLKGDMNELLKEETPFFSEGIKKGDVLCQPGEENCEAKYHWHCENIKATSRTTKVYTMKNWDNTGTETWNITSSNGFGNFSYEHNGTLATVNAVMQKFSRK